jgi:hypothetical protein
MGCPSAPWVGSIALSFCSEVSNSAWRLWLGVNPALHNGTASAGDERVLVDARGTVRKGIMDGMVRLHTGWAPLADHVAPWKAEESGYVSTFNAALRDARCLVGRDIDSGERIEKNLPLALLAGTVVYLVLLEQIGKSLSPKSGRDIKGESEIERAIRQFSPKGATKLERQVLYALRCAIAHDYGLMNWTGSKNAKKQAALTRLFALDDRPGTSLFRRPAQRWSGKVRDASLRTSTTVSLVAVADLAEEVVKSVRIHSNKTTLRSRLPITELQQRFGFERT